MRKAVGKVIKCERGEVLGQGDGARIFLEVSEIAFSVPRRVAR